MRILLKKAHIHHKHSRYHAMKRDILIVDGIIERISAKIEDEEAVLVASKNLEVSPAWVDIGALSGEPGFEYREDLDSVRRAAAQGGYGKVALFPNTQPVIDNKAQVQQMLNANDDDAVVELWPLAAVTSGGEGNELSEIIDLSNAGAYGFTDGVSTHISHNQLTRVVDYVKLTNKPYIHVLSGNHLSKVGLVNEGKMSVSLGLEGIPRHLEEGEIRKLLQVAAYCGNHKVIVYGISAFESVKVLSSPQAKGMFLSVPYLNLIEDEMALSHFDVNLKVLPPLRTRDDRKGLVRAFNDGKIHLVSSNHRPRSVEEKDEPFGLSAFGCTGLEECVRSILTYAPDVNKVRLIEAVSHSSYQALDIQIPELEEGYPASLTIFDTSVKSSFNIEQRASKSRNSPFKNEILQGKVIGIVNGAEYIIH